MYNIPCNKDLLQASSIPLATVITPFAETGPSEVSNVIISRTLRPKTNRRKNFHSTSETFWSIIHVDIL